MKTDVKISSAYSLMFCIEINVHAITLTMHVRCKLGIHCLSHFRAYQEVHSGHFPFLALSHIIHVHRDVSYILGHISLQE